MHNFSDLIFELHYLPSSLYEHAFSSIDESLCVAPCHSNVRPAIEIFIQSDFFGFSDLVLLPLYPPFLEEKTPGSKYLDKRREGRLSEFWHLAETSYHRST